MVKISDKLGEIVGGFFRIKTKDETEFELAPTEEHKRKLLFNYKQITELAQRTEKQLDKNQLSPEKITENDTKSKELHDEQNNIIKSVIKKSYPEFQDEQISAIMLRYDSELLAEIYMAFGWIDKAAMKAMEKKRDEEIKKLSGEAETPEKKPKNKEQ